MDPHLKKPPFFKSWKFWISAGIVVPVLVVVIFTFNASREYSQRIAALKAAGVPTNFRELNDHYRVPDGDLNSTEQWMTAICSLDESAIEEVAKSLPFVGRATSPTPSEAWPALDEARQFLKDQQATLGLTRAAIATGGVIRFDVDFAAWPGAPVGKAQKIRPLGRLLCLDNLAAFRDGDFDRVHANTLGLFQSVHALRLECSLIGQLIRNALQAIAVQQTMVYVSECEWTDDQLKSLQEVAAGFDSKAALENAEIGERVFGLEMMGLMSPLQTIGNGPQLEFLKYYDSRSETLELPWHEHLKAHGELDETLKRRRGFIDSIRLMQFQLLAPASLQVTRSFARTVARNRCCIAVIAVERQRLAEGEAASELRNVPARYFPTPVDPDCLLDPFTGEPLKYLISDQAIMVYSVGADAEDDSGSVAFAKGSVEEDIGFRLLLKPVNGEARD